MIPDENIKNPFKLIYLKGFFVETTFQKSKTFGKFN